MFGPLCFRDVALLAGTNSAAAVVGLAVLLNRPDIFLGAFAASIAMVVFSYREPAGERSDRCIRPCPGRGQV